MAAGRKPAWLANAWLEKDPQHLLAIRLLIQLGDPAGEQRLWERLHANSNPHHEMAELEVKYIWKWRHRDPAMALAMLVDLDEGEADSAFRAKLGDPTAQRIERFETEQAKPLSKPSTYSMLYRSKTFPANWSREQRCELLLRWARESWGFAPPLDKPLQIARQQKCQEVSDELEGNPYLLNMLFTQESRRFMESSAGILSAGAFLLSWAELKPTKFLGQIIATALNVNPSTLAYSPVQKDVEKQTATRSVGAARWSDLFLRSLWLG